ncbi:MAG: glycosyltransferase family 2 protein [Candidatus Marinimicrobia bacterium]|nr:glycosyltransferase family 2 protein [Candidatus Neomarinimicrobiota bacterium]
MPHYNGVRILQDCLQSLQDNTNLPVHVILIDNGSTDSSLEMVHREFPEVQVLQMEENLGFAGGCNAGIRGADSEFVLILNNDTIHRKGWISHLLERIQAADDIAVVQPKIHSYQNKGKFDYSGAAGGEMDIFGFPFARGRLFENIEKDEHQYDQEDDIFWASGTAFLARRKLIIKAGLFDEDFFAHMEEIDLDWRLHLMGYRIVVEPKAVIWHRSGYTLGAETFLKKYLNHRNSLFMFISNYKLFTTGYLLPLRLVLDWLSVFSSFFKGDFKRSAAVIKAHFWILCHPLKILKKRSKAKALRKIGDFEIMNKLYIGSIALTYYLFKKKKYSSLNRPAA